MHTIRLAVTAIVTSALIAGRPATAQRAAAPHHIEISAVAGYVTADGKDFSGTNGAIGFGGIARYFLFGHLGFGVGVHYSDHGLQTLPEHLHIRAIYAECRYSAQLGTAPVTLFAGPRAGWIHEQITIVDWEATGSVIGGLAGLGWRSTSRLGLEFQISETVIHLGDRRAADGSVMSGTEAHGSSFGLEGGLVISF